MLNLAGFLGRSHANVPTVFALQVIGRVRVVRARVVLNGLHHGWLSGLVGEMSTDCLLQIGLVLVVIAKLVVCLLLFLVISKIVASILLFRRSCRARMACALMLLRKYVGLSRDYATLLHPFLLF